MAWHGIIYIICIRISAVAMEVMAKKRKGATACDYLRAIFVVEHKDGSDDGGVFC